MLPSRFFSAVSTCEQLRVCTAGTQNYSNSHMRASAWTWDLEWDCNSVTMTSWSTADKATTRDISTICDILYCTHILCMGMTSMYVYVHMEITYFFHYSFIKHFHLLSKMFLNTLHTIHMCKNNSITNMGLLYQLSLPQCDMNQLQIHMKQMLHILHMFNIGYTHRSTYILYMRRLA